MSKRHPLLNPKRTREGLFVDDMPDIHKYTKKIARKLNLKHIRAIHPNPAMTHLLKRMYQATSLKERIEKELQKKLNPATRKRLTIDLSLVSHIIESPFDLVVTDINMPKFNPSGVRFVSDIRTRFPRQKIIVHSDDWERIEDIQEQHAVPAVNKLPVRTAESRLEAEIISLLKPIRQKT